MLRSKDDGDNNDKESEGTRSENFFVVRKAHLSIQTLYEAVMFKIPNCILGSRATKAMKAKT